VIDFDAKALLEEALVRFGQTWSEEDRQMAAEALLRYGALVARRAAGQDVTADLAHAEAAVLNLKAGPTVVSAAIGASVVARIVVGLLAGLV
jgi:hypothetical protein